MRILLSALAVCVLSSACVMDSSPGRAAPAASSGGAAGGGGGSSSGASLAVQNGSSETICYLYLSPSSDSNWGPDRLGSNVLSPGQQYTASLTAGAWDVKAEDCNHRQLYERRSVGVSGSTTLSLSN